MSFASLPSFIALSLQNALGVPSTKLPIGVTSSVSYLLPTLVCYFIAALLAVTPQTRTTRLALWPPVALLALRAVLSVDMSRGKTEQTSVNISLAIFMFTAAVRTLDWALTKGPLVRHIRPAKSSPSIITDAIDLISNFRGCGWEWSRYQSYIPRETRPANRTAFVLYTFLSMIVHTLISGALLRAVVVLAPVGAGPLPGGSTIFDETLAFPVRYLRGSIISVLTAFVTYASVQTNYDLGAILGILVLGQDPVQWPPIFNTPWFATSLSDFWGRRWHQLMRHTLLFLGGYPLSFVLGRAGIVIGTFLSSAVLHHITLITLNSEMELWWMPVGFGMMGPGVLAERAFYHWTGKRVGGVVGWVWTMAWLILWGNVIIEGYARAGMFGSSIFIDSVLPVRIPLEGLAANFDAWLHTI